MPEKQQNEQVPPKLSARIETHRVEAQALVKQGGEQPNYEYKRSVTLGRDSLEDRLDFVKLVQSVSNADISGERCIVIGGDPKEKAFHPVVNPADFDPANLSKILKMYLDPLPLFSSCPVTTDDGIPFFLIVLEASQPTPIVVIKQGQTEKGKTRLEEGDVWIKSNTNTVRATRADLDRMYKVRMEEEAEDRARKRFDHFREVLPSVHAARTAAVALPSAELIFGPRTGLRAFMAELLATDDDRRFKMLLELCRETLVEGWDRFEHRDSAEGLAQFFSRLDDFRTNQFLPALDSVVDLGLLVIKHNARSDSLTPVVDLLIETFDAGRRLIRFQRYGSPKNDKFPASWWRPAFDTYYSIRTLAAYAVTRQRLTFLGEILPRVVTRLSMDPTSRDVRAPMILWPFWGLSFDDFKHGRATYFWQDRIAAAWGTYFGNEEKFVAATEQLELLLELNSYFGTNQIQDLALEKSLQDDPSGFIAFEYTPDLFARELGTTLPMAETLYDVMASEAGFPDHLAVDLRIRLFINNHLRPQRLELLGGFLHSVKAWQSQFRFQGLRAWGFMWDWPGRLKKIVDAFREKDKAKQAARPK